MTNLAKTAWLTVVGIGEDGIAGISDNAKRFISEATHTFGGKRHLDLADSLITGCRHVWPTPFDSEMKEVVARKGNSTCILASGDPSFFGVGATLARIFSPREMQIIPAPSSFSLAAARLGWALQDVETVSLHGRPIALLRPLLHPGRRILALTSDGRAPAQIAALMTDLGFGASGIVMLEAIGGDNERAVAATAETFPPEEANALNVLAIEVAGNGNPLVLPLGNGIPDHLFEHDGQITKREIRALTLSSLAPRRGELLMDVGAGSGSVSIEWMLAHQSMRAIAIETDPERAARIARNATNCGVPGLTIVHGEAPGAMAGLPVPDAIFIGGGGSDDGVFDRAIQALRPGGRLVSNAVTIKTETKLAELHGRLGGELVRLAVSRAVPIGSMSGWKPAMPVTQWSWTKP